MSDILDESRVAEGSAAHRTISCDACRARKTKCVRAGELVACELCARNGVECISTHKGKKPGPKPSSRNRRPTANFELHLSGPSIAVSPGDISAEQIEQISPLAVDQSISHKSFYADVDLSPLNPPAPFNHSNPLDRILPRAMLMTILGFFHDYVFCIVPYPSWSGLMQDLAGKREERAGEEEWVAMILALVAFVTVQVPHQLFPTDKAGRRAMVQACTSAVRLFLLQPYQIVTLNRLFITYCLAFVSYTSGDLMMCRQYHGINVALALALHLNKEETYTQWTPAQAEMFRRIWWLIYTSDRSGALIDGQATLLPADQLITTREPGAQLFRPSESGDHLLMDGFSYITRIWRIAGRIHSLRLIDYGQPPGGSGIPLRQAELSIILDELNHALDDCPAQLVLSTTTAGSTQASVFPDDLFNAIPDYSQVSPVTLEDPRRAFYIQQANLYITQLCVKFAGIQHQEFLFKLAHPDIAERSHLHDAKDDILASLLRVIQSLPLEMIAVNSMPVVAKIRFVAVTLLEDLDETQPSDKIARAQHYLSQYLFFLSRIEALYSLSDE